MQTYFVQEFAQIAGVTVRTLHYYDNIGLLKPTRRGQARLYRQRDLLRLQQILTLKAMGFSLEEIRDLLDSPGYEIQESLRIQKDAIDRRIEQLQKVSQALSMTLGMLGNMEDLDWAHVSTIIRIVSSDDTGEWRRRYYSDEVMARIAAREVSPDTVRNGERAWLALIEEYRAHCHLPPNHPQVQALAARQAALIHAFTQGDAEIEAGLRRMYSDFENIPQQYRLYDTDLQHYMNEAYRIYEEGTQ